IEAVKEGRGERLKDEKAIFSGLVWTGEVGVELGLVDGLGSADYVAREVIGVERIVDYTARPDYLERFFERFGAIIMKLLTEQSTPKLR
ncbi:MAG: S49 family peptidase, partial [Thiohalomonadaceae bacterium]